MNRRALATLAVVAATLGCNEHPVNRFEPNVIVERQKPTVVDPSEKLDLLWVIDNSGSMCEEQTVLRENFDRFIETLDEAVLDVHIGVTTTHMRDDYTFEPVARPGYLQATPQPIPWNAGDCVLARDQSGSAIARDYTPLRKAIETAVSCMAEPDLTLLDVSDDEIADALQCSVPGMCQPGERNGLRLFPDPSTYRELSKVMRSDDYRLENGTLDIERMRADFACMSLVGTRGYGFEKGLGALVEAVSPELTGGTVESPVDVSAPNHGFIREDARFATVFVTDENDCTHDGSLGESTCGSDACAYWNHADLDGDATPLIDPVVLKEAAVANLAATKNDPSFTDAGMLVASIHGRSQRYSGPVVPDETCRVDDPSQSTTCEAFDACTSRQYEELPPSCATVLGEAYSGDRYERFLRSFPVGQYFPEVGADPTQPLTGWMCAGNFRPALVAIADFLKQTTTGCITTPIQTCDPGASACPSHPGGEPGQCVPRPNSDEYFCDSYVQMRVNAANDRRSTLEAAGFCGSESDTGQCVVPPTSYSLAACSGGVAGVKIEWGEPNIARQALAGTELELRWVSTSAE